MTLTTQRFQGEIQHALKQAAIPATSIELWNEPNTGFNIDAGDVYQSTHLVVLSIHTDDLFVSDMRFEDFEDRLFWADYIESINEDFVFQIRNFRPGELWVEIEIAYAEDFVD